MLDVFLWDEDAYVVDVTLCEKPTLVGYKCNGAEFHDVNPSATPHGCGITAANLRI